MPFHIARNFSTEFGTKKIFFLMNMKTALKIIFLKIIATSQKITQILIANYSARFSVRNHGTTKIKKTYAYTFYLKLCDIKITISISYTVFLLVKIYY